MIVKDTLNKLGIKELGFYSDGLIKNNLSAPVAYFFWVTWAKKGVLIFKTPRVYGCYKIRKSAYGRFYFERKSLKKILSYLRQIQTPKNIVYENLKEYNKVEQQAFLEEGI